MSPSKALLPFLAAALVVPAFSQIALPGHVGAAPAITGTRLVTDSTDGDANGEVTEPVLAGDGRWLVFSSDATDLVDGDVNGVRDVFVKDLTDGTVTLLSTLPGVLDGSDADSYEPTICDDGSVVAFTSGSDLLDESGNDFNFEPDTYVVFRDVDGDGTFDEDGDTRLVRASVGLEGAEALFGATSPSLSGDCQWLAYATDEAFSDDDSNDLTDVYVQEVSDAGMPTDPGTAPAPILVSGTVDPTNYPTGGGGFLPRLSETGRYVAFASTGNALVGGADAAYGGTFRHDRDTDADGVFDEADATTNELASATSTGSASTGVADGSSAPSITPDGRCVAFRFSNGYDLANDVVNASGVFLHDFTLDTTELISKSSAGVQASEAGGASVAPNCRYVSFDSGDSILATGDTNGQRDAFVRDRYLGITELVSRNGAGSPAAGSTLSVQATSDRQVVVTSSAPNLGGASGGNGTIDSFLLGYSAPGFNGLTKPVRLLDTRSGKKGLIESLGGSLGADVTTALPANTVRRYVVTGSNTGIPAAVAGLAANLTVLAPTASGSVKVYACSTIGATAPTIETVLFSAGRTTSYGAMLRTAANGGLCVRSTVAVNVTLDTSGFFTTESGMTTLPKSVRLLDTRSGKRGTFELAGGSIGSDVTLPLAANTPRRFVMTSVAGIPASVDAVSLSLSAIAPASASTVKVYPCSTTGVTRPTAWSMLVPSGKSVSDSQVVKVAANGGLCLLSSVATNVTLDVNGYVASGTGYAGLTRPTVMVDTRSGKRGALELAGGSLGADVAAPLGAGSVTRFNLASQGGLPASASGISANVSVIGASAAGTLRVYPCSSTASPKPTSSSIEYGAGTSDAHSEIVALGSGGGLCVYTTAAAHVVLSVSGSFDS